MGRMHDSQKLNVQEELVFNSTSCATAFVYISSAQRKGGNAATRLLANEH